MPSSRAAIILVGGRSSRFGSNKALETLAGKPLIRHIVERLSDVSNEVFVVIGRDEPRAKYHAV
ncbi:molybdenum cofactor guanylyltransferase, partial [[Eubacterium] cellulosolvens]